MSTETHSTHDADVSHGCLPSISTSPNAGEEISTAFLRMPVRPQVMMVDDEKLNSFVVAEYLKADGYRDLVYTTNPCEALALAHEVRPDVILLDLQMPQLSGFEILRQLRADETFARTAIVILTASDDEKVKERALAMGATDFMQKGIDRDSLLAHLRRIAAADQNQGP